MKKRKMGIIITVVMVLLLIVLIIEVLIFSQNRGNISGKAAEGKNGIEVRRQEQIDFIKKDIDELLKKSNEILELIPLKDDSLKEILDHAQAGLLAHQYKLDQKLSDQELNSLLHLYPYQLFRDKIVYAEKMIMLPKILDELQVNIRQFEEQAVALDIRFDLNFLDTIKNKDQELRELHNNGEFQNILNEIENLRSSVLPDILELTKIASEKNYDQQFQRALDEVRWSITLKFPHNYKNLFEPSLRNSQLESITKYLLKEPNSLTGAASTPGSSAFQQASGPPQRTLRIAVCMLPWNANMQIPLTNLNRIMSSFSNNISEFSFNNHHTQLQYAGNSTWRGPLPNDDISELWAAIEVCDPSIDYRNIDGMILYPSHFNNGVATLGPMTHLTADGVLRFGIVWIGNPPASNVITHEIGHAIYGLMHANAIDANGGRLEYGNPFDIMGSLGGHFSGWYKYYADMIYAETIRSNGDYLLNVLERPSAQNPHVLRIPFRSLPPLCLEYRKPIGSDVFQNYPSYGQFIPNEGCLFINECPISGYRAHNGIYLIDTHPNTITPLDSCLREREIFRTGNVTINFTLQSTMDLATVSIRGLNDNDTERLPDIKVFLGANSRCEFYGEQIVSIQLNNEMHVNQPVLVQLLGIKNNGRMTIFEEKFIPSFVPTINQVITYSFRRPVQLRELIARVDPYNQIPEINETNNEDRVQRPAWCP